MHHLVRSALFAASVAIISPAVANAKMPTASPFWGGTWQLNLAASKLGAPAGMRSETRVYEVHGNNLTVTATGTDPSGKAMKYSYSGAFDGKAHRMVGNPVGDNIALSLVNPRKANITVRMGTVVTATATSDVSPDGKRLTLNRKTLHGKSSPTLEVLAFDKK